MFRFCCPAPPLLLPSPLWQIKGKNAAQYVCLDDFCTCPAFAYSVVQKAEQFCVCLTSRRQQGLLHEPWFCTGGLGVGPPTSGRGSRSPTEPTILQVTFSFHAFLAYFGHFASGFLLNAQRKAIDFNMTHL